MYKCWNISHKQEIRPTKAGVEIKMSSLLRSADACYEFLVSTQNLNWTINIPVKRDLRFPICWTKLINCVIFFVLIHSPSS